MKKIYINFAKDFVGQEVLLAGWVYNLRSSGSICFLQIRDGSGFLQAIISKEQVAGGVWEKAQTITMESSVELTGEITKHPKKEEYELQVKDLKIINLSEEYPISKKEHGPDFLLDNRHLWLRSPKQWAIQRVRNTIINATYEYFNAHSFIKIDAPILTPNACEGTTELFEINYFDWTKAYLSQSGQLYIEAAIFAHGRVFDFGPVFRAEKSKTRRHLTEFWMMDAEMAFCDYQQNMEVQEELTQYIVEQVLAKNQNELLILERDIEPLKKIKAPFIRKTHSEVVKELQAMGSDIKDGDDLGADDETMLTKKYEQPIFVTHYPAEVKAFYMKRDETGKFALCSDLLAPEGYGEVIGGSEREADYKVLLERIKEYNLPVEQFAWYLDLRKYGSVPHSGFGYGLERLVAWICGLEHIRETIPFPRLINRINP
jgi:asparaginyl-tRNA synthetase